MAQDPFAGFGDDLDFSALEIEPTDDDIKKFREHFWADTYQIGDESFTRHGMAKPYWKLDRFVTANHLDFTGYSEVTNVPPGPGKTSAGTMSGDHPCVTIFKFAKYANLQIANTFEIDLTGGQPAAEQVMRTVISFKTPNKFPEIYIGHGIAQAFEYDAGQKVTAVGEYEIFAPEPFHAAVKAAFDFDWITRFQEVAPKASLLIRGNHAHIYMPDKFRAAEKDAWQQVINVVKALGPGIYNLQISDPAETKLRLGKLRGPFRLVRSIVLFSISVAIYMFWKWIFRP